MESATILTPQAVFCFPSELNIPEGPEYEKIQTLSSVLLACICSNAYSMDLDTLCNL